MRALGQAPGDGEGDIGQKYAKRSSGIRRSLQRFFPSFFQPGLPVTSRCPADHLTTISIAACTLWQWH